MRDVYSGIYSGSNTKENIIFWLELFYFLNCNVFALFCLICNVDHIT